jgi:RNA polymerase sigma-70 factor (ECF subfamily)
MSNPDVARYFALAQPKLRAFIRSMVFNSSDVDDILQDVVAIENSDRYDPSRSLDGWVFGITRNRVLKYIEKSKRQKLSFCTEVVDALAESAQTDSDSDYSLELLGSCLQKLDPEKRELVMRRHQPGTTARQLAQEIGYTDTRICRLFNSVYSSLMKCVQRQLA